MPNIDKLPAARFCWIELHTTDRPAASDFYTKLFAWEAQHMPMGPGPNDVYTIFQLNGRSTGAATSQMGPGERPNWLMYVAVDSADDSSAKALAAGAKSLMPVGDVGDFGRMTVLSDPDGAILALWQAKQHPGLGIIDEPGALCWAENYTNNEPESRAFYAQLFGWIYKGGADYTEIHSGDKAVGGILQIRSEWKGMPPCWLPYFMVADCAAAVKKVQELGGKELMPAKSMPDVGTFSMVADPQGATFFVFQSARS